MAKASGTTKTVTASAAAASRTTKDEYFKSEKDKLETIEWLIKSGGIKTLSTDMALETMKQYEELKEKQKKGELK